MKFKIRFADQIVGIFIILSILSLVFVTVMLGRSQRWFARDLSFYTTLSSAGGLSRNMAVQYRGFTVGNIRDFHLIENGVSVHFTIHEEYRDRVRQGSTVEVLSSPIGLGNQFLLHAGRGQELPDGAFVPVTGSVLAREMILLGLADEPQAEDGISLIMSRVASVLDEAQRTLAQVNEAFGAGTDATELGRIAISLRRTMADLESVPGTVEQTLGGISAGLHPILRDIDTITTELSDPEGLLFTALSIDGEVYTSLVESLAAAASILESLDRAAAFIPAQLPQIAGLIMDLRVTVQSAEDVLTALTNNPLLRRGVPERLETSGGGAAPRNIRF